jgi:hypothetical protein
MSDGSKMQDPKENNFAPNANRDVEGASIRKVEMFARKKDQGMISAIKFIDEKG